MWFPEGNNRRVMSVDVFIDPSQPSGRTSGSGRVSNVTPGQNSCAGSYCNVTWSGCYYSSTEIQIQTKGVPAYESNIYNHAYYFKSTGTENWVQPQHDPAAGASVKARNLMWKCTFSNFYAGTSDYKFGGGTCGTLTSVHADDPPVPS
jgi:hypothetical protein